MTEYGKWRSLIDGASVIPDAGLLHQHVATDGVSGSVSGWDDQTGSLDLSGSATSVISDAIDGEPAIEFDGTDDQLDGSRSAFSEPYEQFAVMRLTTAGDGEFYFMSDASDDDVRAAILQDSDNEFQVSDDNNDAVASGVSSDTDYHLFNMHVKSGEITLRLDGSEIANNTDASTGNFDGFTVGYRGDDVGFNSPMEMAENLWYDPNESGYDRSDVEDYISSKYPTLPI